MNRTINALRNKFWRILLEDDTQVRHDLFDQLCQDIARFPEPVRPGRSQKRSSPRNKRFPITKKSVLPTMVYLPWLSDSAFMALPSLSPD